MTLQKTSRHSQLRSFQKWEIIGEVQRNVWWVQLEKEEMLLCGVFYSVEGNNGKFKRDTSNLLLTGETMKSKQYKSEAAVSLHCADCASSQFQRNSDSLAFVAFITAH